MKTNRFPAKRKEPELPVLEDFSPESTARSVRGAILQHPTVVWPMVAGGIGFAALLSPWLVAGFVQALVIVSSVAVGFGVLSLAHGFGFRREVMAKRYLEQYNDRLREHAGEMARYLEHEFTELEFPRGAEQIEQLQKRVDVLERALGEKFDTDGTTYQQYLGAADALYVKTLNCLKDAVTQLRTNQAYTPEEIRSDGDESEKASIERRRELYEEGDKRFDALIASVEKAITGLAELAQEVASVSSGGAHTHEEFVEKIRALASSAGFLMDERHI